ncbi:MAG: hypothetical protein IV100_24655 [Myxococcales bacterium]|nr:hypothetical protein [Myxococcales bacterium]
MGSHRIIFVHGIGIGENVRSYDQLWNGATEAWNELHPGHDFRARFDRVDVHWDDAMAEAQVDLFKAAFPNLTWRGASSGWASNLTHPIEFLRTLVTAYVGDAVGYSSEADNKIRRRFWDMAGPAMTDGVPWTLVGHSLGSCIGFDFLFDLFDPQRGLRIFEPIEATPAVAAKARAGFRGFVSFGSPIGLFMLRRAADLHVPGAPQPWSKIRNPVPEGIPWVNCWDKQDIIAYPLEGLFGHCQGTSKVKDVCVDTGDLIINSHIRYWRNRDVARELVLALPQP